MNDLGMNLVSAIRRDIERRKSERAVADTARAFAKAYGPVPWGDVAAYLKRCEDFEHGDHPLPDVPETAHPMPASSGIVRTTDGWLINGQHFKADADGWIPHENTATSVCPVPEGVAFRIKYRDGSSVISGARSPTAWRLVCVKEKLSDYVAWMPVAKE